MGEEYRSTSEHFVDGKPVIPEEVKETFRGLIDAAWDELLPKLPMQDTHEWKLDVTIFSRVRPVPNLIVAVGEDG